MIETIQTKGEHRFQVELDEDGAAVVWTLDKYGSGIKSHLTADQALVLASALGAFGARGKPADQVCSLDLPGCHGEATQYVVDPYDQDVNDRTTYIWVCDGPCLARLCDEI